LTQLITKKCQHLKAGIFVILITFALVTNLEQMYQSDIYE
jgi:hypothetical protein